MKILDGKVDWMEYWSNHPHYMALIDKMPDHNSLIFKKKDMGNGCASYYAEQDGYVSFNFYDPRDQRGYNGRAFTYKLEDGTVDVVNGPWSSNSVAINKAFGVETTEISLIDQQADFDRGYTFYACHITVDKLKEVARLIPNVYLLKIILIEMPNDYKKDEFGLCSGQLNMVFGRPYGTYYIPSLDPNRPVKWSLPWSKKEPRTKKEFLDTNNNTKIASIERLV